MGPRAFEGPDLPSPAVDALRLDLDDFLPYHIHGQVSDVSADIYVCPF